MQRKIFIVEDQPIIRRGYKSLINREPDLTVCGEADTPAEALKRIREAAPDLVLADITFEGMNGIEMTKRLRAWKPELRVLVVSMHDEALYGERALRAGARGYIMKDEVDTVVVRAIRRLLAGGFYLSEPMNARLLAQYVGHAHGNGRAALKRLTDRELQVFEHLGRGRSTHEIAEALRISPKTVESHRGRIKRKLGLETTATLVQHAVQWIQNEERCPAHHASTKRRAEA